jgi:catechol 2,3-dioxygenase
MAMTGVMRPGFVQIRVLDMKASLNHYRDRIGLDVVEEAKDGRVYMRGYDEFDRHSIILRQADSAGMDVMGWKVAKDSDLDAFKPRLEAMGMKTEWIAAGEQPTVGRRLSFVLPTGHRFDLYAEMEQSKKAPMVDNPDLWEIEPRGMRAQRFDHCLLYGPDVQKTADILMKALDFSLAERADTPDGMLAAFLTCSNKAHDIAFVMCPDPGKFHHVSFLLESWHDVGHAADIIARFNISLDIGPTRHGITRGQTIYFFDPSGNRNEVFAGGYAYYPDNPVRTWSGDQLGKGIFYYEKELNERFLSVVT